MLFSTRIFGGWMLAGAVCLAAAQTQEQMDAAARAALVLPELKGTLISCATTWIL